MKESPLIKLISIRKATQITLEREKEPKVDARNEELESLRKYNQTLLEKIKTNEDLLAKNMNAMRHEIENRDKEIFRLKQEIVTKESEKSSIQKELYNSQQRVSDVINDKEEMMKMHSQQLADLRLKHDQEIYILRKIKKN